MNAEIVCVGTELLLGDIINTNAAFIARRLASMGINCFYHTVVGDNAERLQEQVRQSLERSDLVIFTGGLGPTYDDVTKDIVAKALDLPLEFNQEILDQITLSFAKSNRTVTEENIRQNLVPKDTIVFKNDNGIAPGLCFEVGDKAAILLPGPPKEMQPMFENHVEKYLAAKSNVVLYSTRISLTGIGESLVERYLNKEMTSYTNPTIAPYINKDGVLLRITASSNTIEHAKELIEPVIERIYEIFGTHIYGVDVESLEEVVVAQLLKEKKSLSIIDNCIGGQLADRILSIMDGEKVVNLSQYSNQHHIIAYDGSQPEQEALRLAREIKQAGCSEVGVSIIGSLEPSTTVNHYFTAVSYHDLDLIEKHDFQYSNVFERERLMNRMSSLALSLIVKAVNT